MMKQKEAVYQAITNLFDISGDGAVELDRGQKHEVIEVLMQSFKAGKISYDGELPVDKDLRNYCSGLLNNWLRKDSRLNGGVKYEPKNPGSRQGISDPQLRALKALLRSVTDPSDKADIEAYIAARQAELNKAKAPTVDYSALPESLRAKFAL